MSLKGCIWGIIILENSEMVEFRKKVIIVLDKKFVHLSTHFFSFKNNQILAEFGVFVIFWDF